MILPAWAERWRRSMKYKIFGESHGPAIGIVIDGIPSGLALDMDYILSEMERRAPGRNRTSTSRKEPDIPEILSGVKDMVTTGAPLCAVIRNSDMHSTDYSEIARKPRPSHSDYAAWVRYHGENDIRGGGHFSGRLTAPLVFAGAVAKLWLKTKGVTVSSTVLNIGGVENPDEDQIEQVIMDARASEDSVGGILRLEIADIPAGIGGPDYGDNLEGELARALFAVPAVKGVQFGAGFGFASMRGSQANDPFRMENGKVVTGTNHSGGINGGISNGMPVVLDVAFRPTPSIGMEQKTIDLETQENTTLRIRGRHDPCIVLRARPAAEAAVAVAVMDLIQRSSGEG